MPKGKILKKRSSRLTNSKEFYSDLSFADMLYAAVIRSPAKKGIVTSVSHPDLPDGYTLITARDVPGSNLIDTPGGKIPIFCDGNISYEGAPIALLVGPEESVLETLKNEIIIQIDDTPIESYLFSPETTTDSNSIENEMFSPTIAERTFEYGDTGSMEHIFETAEYVEQNCFQYSLNPPNYGEPNGAICNWKDKSLMIYTPTQWLSSLRSIVSETMNIDPDIINVKRTKSYNHGTNSIWFNSIIACQAAVASKKTNRPVKLVYSRQEQIRFIDTMQPITIAHKSACDKDGKLLAMQVQIDVDAGYANPLSQEIVDRLVIASLGCYKADTVSVKTKIIRSHNPSSSIDIQLIDSAAFFALENQMTLLASKTKFTPVEFRQKNSIGTFDKKKNAYPFIFNLENFSETLSALTKISDYNRKYASYHLDAIQRKIDSVSKNYDAIYSSPLRGIGMACAWEGSGYYGSVLNSTNQSIELTLEEDKSVTIHSSPVSQSITEIWTKLVSESLEIPPSQIKIKSDFETDEEPELPENLYSNISIMTQLVKKCCDSIKNRKTKTLPYTVKKKNSASTKKEWNHENFTGKPFHSTSFACCTVEIELNPCTYREIIRKINIVINGGKILSPHAAECSIKLSIQKLLASLVRGDTIVCDDIKINFVQSEENPTQIGELIYQILPAAYTQALTQALSCKITSLPLETDSLYYKLCEQKIVENAQKIAEEMSNEQEVQDEDSDNAQ